MAKENSGLTTKNRRKSLTIFSLLILIIAGVILGVTYWPAKSTDITSMLSSQIDVSKEENVVQEFINTNKSTFINNKNVNYANEMATFQGANNAMRKAYDFYVLSLNGTIDGNIARRDVKQLDSLLKDVESNLNKMEDFITEHKNEMISFTVIKSTWENIRIYYNNILADYEKIFTKLYDIYSKSKLEGIYGNDMMILSIKGMKSYYEVINAKIFGKKEFVKTAEAVNLVEKLNKFTNNIYYDNKELITEYYLDDDIKAKVDKLNKLEEKTEVKVNFSYILKNNFDCSGLNFTETQSAYVDFAITFLKGDLSV